MRQFHALKRFIFMTAIALIAAGGSAEEMHPRLFLTPERLESIRNAIEVEGSHHRQAFEAMKERVDQRNYQVYDDGVHYAMSYLAREAAMMYAITGDTTYSRLAFMQITAIMATEDNLVRRPDSGYALGRGTTGLNIALAYDWSYAGWPEAMRSWVRDLIVRSLNKWTNLEYPDKKGNHVWKPYISNWVPVALGSQLVMMLSVYEEDLLETDVYEGAPFMTRRYRYKMLKDTLSAHLRNAYGELGVTGESIGYASYSGSFLAAAVFALNEVGDADLNDLYYSKGFWKWVMYANSFADGALVLQNGIAGEDIGAQGWFSVLLNTVPQDSVPYYKYFYDRTVGVRGAVPEQQKFDGDRAGTTWSLLYYPEGVIEKNPTDVFPAMAVDTARGAFFFRNRWQDKDDVLFLLMADAGWQENVWNHCEAFSMNLIANNRRFFAGPGKKDEPELFSSLLVDGKAYVPSIPGEEPSDTGAVAFYTINEKGGYAIADGAQKYMRLGCQKALRHVAVDFNQQGLDALIGVFDQLESAMPRTFTWQINVGSSIDSGGIVVSAGEENGVQTFTLSADNDAYVKGWVLSPADATITAGDPLQVTAEGTDVDIFIPMAVGKGAPPEATISGEGIESVLSVYDANISFNAATGRIEGVTPVSVEKWQTLKRRRPASGIKQVRYDVGSRALFVEYNRIGYASAAVAIQDMQGKTVGARRFVTERSVVRVDLSRPLAAGVYLVRLHSGARTSTKRLLIRK